MPYARDDVKPRTRDLIRKLLRDPRRIHEVELAHDDARRHGDRAKSARHIMLRRRGCLSRERREILWPFIPIGEPDQPFDLPRILVKPRRDEPR